MQRRRKLGPTVAAVAGAAALSLAASLPVQAGTARAGTARAGAAEAVAATAALSAGRSARAAADTGWRIVLSSRFKDQANVFNAVVALSRDDAWVFGGSSTGSHGYPVAEHWNGARWSAVSLPAGLDGSIFAASATSPSDIWAASFQSGYVLHWNGTSWSVAMRWHPKTPLAMSGITAVSPDDVWLFGASGDSAPYGGSSIIGMGTWHYNGHTWTQERAEYGRNVDQASALSAGNVWGIGGWPESTDFVDHFNGTTWQKVDPPAIASMDEEKAILAESAGDVWVDGVDLETSQATPVLAHWNGTNWQDVAFPGQSIQPLSMSPDGSGGLWLVVDGWDTDVHEMMHRSASGAWTHTSLTQRELMYDVAQVPGTTSQWGVGPYITGANSSDAVIWAYASTG